jgi:glutamate racemase
MKQENEKELCGSAPIGVFDSGIGGLTVVRELMRQLPNERIIYFGDTARVPYGSKSKDTVTKFSKQIVRFLRTHQIKTIVVACNTASAYALEELEQESDIPILGVVGPGTRAAVEATRNGRIGVIATEATIGSRIYQEYISQLGKDVQIFQKACPLFVPLVEEGLWEDPVTDEIAKRYLGELIDHQIDTLLLGCTHYPLLRSTLGRLMGEQVTLVNPAYETAKALKQMLTGKGLLNSTPPVLGEGENQYQFYVSDMAEKFKTFANSIIAYGILSAKTVNIEDY